MRRQVIFDTDPSPDDAVAFLAALASPEDFDVLAITTVAGNVPVEITSKNVRKALELANKVCVKTSLSTQSRRDRSKESA